MTETMTTNVCAWCLAKHITRRQKFCCVQHRKSAHLLMRKYGLTISDYLSILEKQGGTCAICPATESKPGEGNKLAVDHDHRTGKVRGLLCAIHNRAIGLCDDSPDLFDRISAYLRGSA